MAGSLLATGPALAQAMGFDTGGGGKSQPVNISADNGIEWRQAEHVYIAHGNVKAVRGPVTVYADEMRAYYRPVAKKPGGTGAPPPIPSPRSQPAAAKQPGDPAKKAPGPQMNEGSTEIYRIDATGSVRFVTATQTAYGDHATYDIDHTLLVMTGKHLKVVTPHDTLTARDTIEWYDNRQLGVARGDAVDDHEGKTIAGDVLMATMIPGQDKDKSKDQSKDAEAHISRIDANGNVLVSSKDQIGRGDTGVYDVKKGTVTLSGHVRLTRGQNEMRGAYGVIDLNRNVGRLLPAPPGKHVALGGLRRVEGLIVPPKPVTPAARAKTGAKRGTTVPSQP
jgi:lipopolysaccharide export system protein LptA